MKLTKSEVIKMAEISTLDADMRLEEFKKYGNIEPNKRNYDINKMRALWSNANYFDIENMKGLYGELDGCLFITLRGSDSILDWIRNFIFFKKVIPYDGTNPKIRVHSGFLKNYKIIRKFIHEIVKQYSTITKIVIYGHSMGASTGALMALDIQYNFSDKEIGCFCIGMPRLGNVAFKKSFERRLPYCVLGYYDERLKNNNPKPDIGLANVNRDMASVESPKIPHYQIREHFDECSRCDLRDICDGLPKNDLIMFGHYGLKAVKE